MQFGTGSTTELTQKREGQSTKMPYVRPYIYTNKLDWNNAKVIDSHSNLYQRCYLESWQIKKREIVQ